MATQSNPFVWYDLMTTDPVAAATFYRNVVGWTTQDSGVPGMPYTLLSAGATQVGGLMGIPPDAAARGAGPCWTGYIGVADVDACAQRVVHAGGSIHKAPADIPGVGRFAVALDPFGAAFILFRGNTDEMPQPVAPGTPGHVGWRELYAGDLAAAWTFYSGLFGWTKADAVDMGPMGIYQLFGTGGEPVGGMMARTPDMPPPCWQYYFNVDGADAAAARVTANGGTVTMGPHEVPGGTWIVMGRDPQGAAFALSAPRR